MTNVKICASCGYVGKSTTKIKGSGLIEIILWLFMIFPGIIYSIWRSSSRYSVCPSCGSTNMIPVDTPIGKKLLTEQGKRIEEILLENVQKKPSNYLSNGQVFTVGALVILALIFFGIVFGS